MAHHPLLTPTELHTTRLDSTLLITLNGADTQNALHPEMLAGAIEILSTAERDSSVRAVVLTGANSCFCSGADLRHLQHSRVQDKSTQISECNSLHNWIEAVNNCAKPVIAAVEGIAAGSGFSLALACDLIVASTSARFMMPNVGLGLTPDGGGSWFLSQTLPRQIVAEIMLLGQPVTVARLHQLGVVNRVAAEGEAQDVALALADELAQLPANALVAIKSLLQEAPGNTLEQQVENEKHRFIDNLQHRNAQEGINAFLAKRQANFK